MKNNPPAFPGGSPTEIDKGMTLLDYFAGQAMQGLLASPRPAVDGDELPKIIGSELIARLAYATAISMLEEREKHI